MSRVPNVPHPIPPGIAAAEGDVRALLAALAAALPTAAQGAAMASALLSDGAGPLRSHRSPLDLGAAAEEATRQMKPAASCATMTRLTETVNGTTTSHGGRRCEMDASAGAQARGLAADRAQMALARHERGT